MSKYRVIIFFDQNKCCLTIYLFKKKYIYENRIKPNRKVGFEFEFGGFRNQNRTFTFGLGLGLVIFTPTETENTSN